MADKVPLDQSEPKSEDWCPPKKRGGHTEREPCEHRHRARTDVDAAKGHQGPLEQGETSKGSSLEPSRVMALPTL